MTVTWTKDNSLELLENGEEFFPAVFEAIRNSERSVILETFILFEDKVGSELRQAAIDAAQRGVHVEISVDGYGTADLSDEFIGGLTGAGVGFHVFDPRPRRLGMRTNLFRRLHRKIVVVDGLIAFVGGINFSADHLADFGPTAKQDYAIMIRGPLVDEIGRFVIDALSPVRPRFSWRNFRRRSSDNAVRPGPSVAALVLRDNDRHKDDIEQHYRIGIRAAQHDITIANAYFFPGYRFLRDLRVAAQRGVRVRLILQGEPDMPIARFAATMLYDYLLSAGVQIFEYCERPFHGKVATVDGTWSTIGSSNLDPLSLALNLEANVVVHDSVFTAHLQDRLDALVKSHCQLMQRLTPPRRKIQRVFVGVFVFHFLRRFPAWAGRLPARKAPLTSIQPPTNPGSVGKNMNASSAARIKDWTKAHWGILRKILIVCFLIGVLGLLGAAVAKVDWNEVLEAIYQMPSRALWIAGLITAVSYIAYSSFDILGKWYTEHDLAWWRSMMVGFISYAFTLSLGAPVGGVGLRIRLYSKQGLAQGVIMRIWALSLTTNWIGYALLAGCLFAWGVVELPASWKLDDGPLRILGALMVLAGGFYLGLCAFSNTRSWLLMGHTIELPSFPLAVIQVTLAILNWMLMGLVIYVLFQQKIPFLLVLATLLISAIAGALAHIPGGLGVTESVFIALLAGDTMGHGEMLAALLTYRAIYYLAPLLLAAAWYVAAEAKIDHPAKEAGRQAGH